MADDGILGKIFDKIETLGKDMKREIDDLKDNMNKEITGIKIKMGQQDVFRRPAPECTVFVSKTLEKEMKEKCENLEKRKMNKPTWLGIGVVLSIASIVGTLSVMWLDERFNNVKNQIDNHREEVAE